jgi:glycerol-3-phosphate dehydrogenase
MTDFKLFHLAIVGGGINGTGIDAEFARTGEDVLWRRSRLGLHLPESAQRAVID